MANKLFLVCATLAFCVLLTNASIYRTVVEFEEDDTTNPGPLHPQQKCRKEFQEARHLRACQQWIHKRTMQPRYDDDELDSENPWGPQQQEQHPILQQCCNELRQEDPVCVCPTLKQVAKAVRIQGQHGPFQTSKIFRTAKHLPNACNMPQVGVCPFVAIPFFPPY